MRIFLIILFTFLMSQISYAQMCKNYNNGQQISCDNGLGVTGRQLNGNTYYSDGTRAYHFRNGDTYLFPYPISPNLSPVEEDLADPLLGYEEENEPCMSLFCE